MNLDELRKFLKSHPAYATPTAPILGTPEVASANAPQANHDEMEQPIVGYRMLDKLGSGGMAMVFKAEHIPTGNIVALKLLYPNQDKLALKQFIHEGMILMGLNHPNILKGFDFGISKGFYFLALELVEGESLVPFLEKGFCFTEKHTFQIALQLIRALAYLEKQGIVHRDVKPANILILADTVKLCDFAFALDTKNNRDIEGEAEMTCGTVEYISPEQARGVKNLDGRSDVYSLGMTCLHMMAGTPPFQGSNPQEIMRQQIYAPIHWEQFPNLSAMARKILKAMVAKNVEKRIWASKLAPVLKKFVAQIK